MPEMDARHCGLWTRALPKLSSLVSGREPLRRTPFVFLLDGYGLLSYELLRTYRNLNTRHATTAVRYN